jgi:hypothetical protein
MHMPNISPHTFHIPVMGLGFTIDSPVKVARYGITSVVSIMEDHLIESIRKTLCQKFHYDYIEITKKSDDYRAKRITAYLDLMYDIIESQIQNIKKQRFDKHTELFKYFLMLPENSDEKKLFYLMLNLENCSLKNDLKKELKKMVLPGKIDVNIMTKVDRTTYTKKGEPLPNEYSDALSALRGYCKSKISSSVILSAGMNPRLYAYIEEFSDFYPNEYGLLKKKIVLKVSDYRSALIQGKIFAKKGIWVSEFRIESGLNCGGHAFATQGHLMGPILEEFKLRKTELADELFEMCNAALKLKSKPTFTELPQLKFTAQGGIGNYEEDNFLLNHFKLDGTGWGSPFLLVPESTSVDEKTMNDLAKAKRDEFYLSDSSPLGVRFNNFRNSTSEAQRIQRIEKNKPGSPCYAGFLEIDTEFTEKPICTASRQYQKLKIDQIQNSELSEIHKQSKISKVMEKDCLCEGLGTSARITNDAPLSHKLSAVSICPGPNLSYFGHIYKLTEMVDHIYGRINLRFKNYRPHMFVNEAQLYVDYLKKEIEEQIGDLTAKKEKYFEDFKINIENGLNYYLKLSSSFQSSSKGRIERFMTQIQQLKESLSTISVQKAI